MVAALAVATLAVLSAPAAAFAESSPTPSPATTAATSTPAPPPPASPAAATSTGSSSPAPASATTPTTPTTPTTTTTLVTPSPSAATTPPSSSPATHSPSSTPSTPSKPATPSSTESSARRAAAPAPLAGESAVLGIDKSVSTTAPVTPGSEFAYNLVVDCSSLTVACQDVVLEDVLPAELDVTSLPTSTSLRDVTFDQATRKLRIVFREPLPPPNPAGSTGLPAGGQRTIQVGVRLPTETTVVDGQVISNTATVTGSNAAPKQDSATVTASIPRQIRPFTSKSWADGSAVAQSDEPSTITLGVRNGSTSSAQVSALTVQDITPQTFDSFTVTGLGPVTRFPAGADRVQALVCTQPVGTPCSDAAYLAGPVTAGPVVSPPSGVDLATVTGVRYVFTSAAGTVLAYDPTGGGVQVQLVLRDTLRSTGAIIAPTVRQTVTNTATSSATDPVAGTVVGPEVSAQYAILPNIAVVQATKRFFSDTNGDFVEDGTAVIGQDWPVSMVIDSRNASGFAVSNLTITEPSATAPNEFEKVDVTTLRVAFPSGAVTARITVTCRDGSTPGVQTLTTPPTVQVLTATGCATGTFPSRVSVTFTGTAVTGAGAIADGGSASLGLHGTLNNLAGPGDAAPAGVDNCADSNATNPVNGSGSTTSTPCATLQPQVGVTTIDGTKTVSQTDIPPETPITFTLTARNAGNLPVASLTLTDPPDPTAAGNPFFVVRIDSVSVQAPAGVLTLTELYDPSVSRYVLYDSADAALLARATGLRVRALTPLAPGQQIVVRYVVFLRDGIPVGTPVLNCFTTSLSGDVVGSPFCGPPTTVVAPPNAGGSVQKLIEPASVPRPIEGITSTPATVKLKVQNNGNIFLRRIVATDVDTDFFDAVTLNRIVGVSFPPGADRVQVDACTTGCETGVWVDGVATGSDTPGLPTGAAAADVRGLRVTFSNSNGGYELTPGSNYPGGGPCPGASFCFEVAPRLDLRSAPTTPVPDTLEDTAFASGESQLQPPGGLFPFGDTTATLALVEGTARIDVEKTPDSRLGPGETGPFSLVVRNTGSGIVPGLTVVDPIPTGLLLDEVFAGPDGRPFVATFQVPAGTPEPTTVDFTAEHGDTTDPSRVTRVVWTFPGWEMLPGTVVTLDLQVRLSGAVPPSTVIPNTFGAGSSRPDVTCDLNSPRDGEALDDPTYGPGRFCTSSAEVTTVAGTSFDAEKWVAGQEDLGFFNTVSQTYVPTSSSSCPRLPDGARTYTRFPCIALVNPGGQFDYQLRIRNSGNDPATLIQLVDMLPRPGDTGVILVDQQRGTEWSVRPQMVGEPTLESGGGTLVNLYTNTPDPCLAAIGSTIRSCRALSFRPGFTPDAYGFLSRVSFPLDQGLQPGAVSTIALTLSSPVDLDQAGFPSIAWNSFAHTETVLRDGVSITLPVVEPPKVGVGMQFGNLEVDKRVVNPPAGLPEQTFGIDYECTVTPTGGTPVVVREGDGTDTFTETQPFILAGVPAGAVCRVWETDSGGATSPNQGEANAAIVTIAAVRNITALGNLVITNTYEYGSLQVRKVVTGGAAGLVGQGPFGVTVDCTFRDTQVADFPKQLTLVGGQTETLAGIPVGAVCTVTETDAAGATGSLVTPGSIVIGPDVAAPAPPVNLVTVTNDFPVGSLAVVKRLAGNGASVASGTFTFSLACDWNGRAGVVERTFTLTAPGDLSTTFTDLPVGATCTVTETDSGSADATPPPVGPVTITAGGGPVLTVEISNTFSAGQLTLRKVLTGPGAGQAAATDATYVLAVTCVRTSGTQTVTLLSQDVSIVGAGAVSLPNLLSIGTRCWATEKDAGSAASSSVDFDSVDRAAVVTLASTRITVTATNTFDLPPVPPVPPVNPLPDTGAVVGGFVGSGVLLVGGGLGLLLWARRRRAVEAV